MKLAKNIKKWIFKQKNGFLCKTFFECNILLSTSVIYVFDNFLRSPLKKVA